MSHFILAQLKGSQVEICFACKQDYEKAKINYLLGRHEIFFTFTNDSFIYLLNL